MLRILVNGVVMTAEIAAAAGIAWLGFKMPWLFAVLTGLLAFALGLNLEVARLRNELPFYFDRAPAGSLLVAVVGSGEALVKGLVAAAVALLTFSGTNTSRLSWVALAFGVCVYAGTHLLWWLSSSLGARPSRWGYFRLAAPLGFVFSCLLTALGLARVIATPTLAEIGRHLVLDMPKRPGISEVSEALFLLKQYIDELVIGLLSLAMAPDWARIAGIVLSTNVLAGFVIAIYAVVLAEVTRAMLGRAPGA